MIQKPYLLFLGNAKNNTSAKTAFGIAYFRPQDCVGYIRLKEASITLDKLPELTLLEAKKRGAKTLVIGLANSGGYIEESWIPTIVQAINLGLNIASGLHEKLEDISEISKAAIDRSIKLHNLRQSANKLKTGTGIPRPGKRLLTVGTDCSTGKMYSSLLLEKELQARGLKASFVATGQTGILIAGKGIAVDAVISDFISGAIEMISDAEDDDCYQIIEGQGSLYHPSFAGVSLGLLHGAQADYIVLCHDPSRAHIRNLPHYPIPDIAEAIELNLRLGKLTNPDIKAVGISINSSTMNESDALEYIHKLKIKTGLPVTDPCRFGVGDIVDNILL